MTDEAPPPEEPPWHVLIHTPGLAADPAVPFFEAEWFPGHRGFHASLQELGALE